jgi:hypothetical protein
MPSERHVPVPAQSVKDAIHPKKQIQDVDEHKERQRAKVNTSAVTVSEIERSKHESRMKNASNHAHRNNTVKTNSNKSERRFGSDPRIKRTVKKRGKTGIQGNHDTSRVKANTDTRMGIGMGTDLPTQAHERVPIPIHGPLCTHPQDP